MTLIDRRTFLRAASVLPWAGIRPAAGAERPEPRAPEATPLKLSCNLYSFNDLLRDGTMSLEEVLSFCSDLGFAAVDPTGYYFPDYPHVPTTAYARDIRQHAFGLGLSISGTGVRNDFTVPDDQERQAQVRHVQRWIEAAARLGAPVLRVFAGSGVPDEHTREEVTTWLVDSLQACADYGQRHGVTVAVQNHAEFLETAAQVETVLRRVDGLGLILDIGSLGGPDPYDEIEALAPHAVSWQIKEKVTMQGEKVRTDLDRIVSIVNDAGYRGYLPLETLGPGDPREQVPRFLSAVRGALANH